MTPYSTWGARTTSSSHSVALLRGRLDRDVVEIGRNPAVRERLRRLGQNVPLPTTPPVPGSLRWYWTLYRQSGRWLGNLAIGEEGLAESTRVARTGLIEPLLRDSGERSFAALTRRVLREELKARTPVQVGNLLSALRHISAG